LRDATALTATSCCAAVAENADGRALLQRECLDVQPMVLTCERGVLVLTPRNRCCPVAGARKACTDAAVELCHAVQVLMLMPHCRFYGRRERMPSVGADAGYRCCRLVYPGVRKPPP